MDRVIIKQNDGIIRYTLFDKRWYDIPEIKKNLPSVTWILDDGYPKDRGLMQWLADKVGSWQESREILKDSGERGTNVHWLCERAMQGVPISYDELIEEGRTISHEEYSYFLSFTNFVKLYRPIILGVEQTVWNEEIGYAGTVDILCLISPQRCGLQGKKPLRCIIDLKTSSGIYRTHELQQIAYMKCFPPGEIDKIFLLKLSTRWNAKNGGYKLVEVTNWEQGWQVFLATKCIWEDVHRNASPNVYEVPEKVVLWNMYQDEQDEISQNGVGEETVELPIAEENNDVMFNDLF